MDQKKGKPDMFAKFQKKAGEKDKAALKPEKEAGNLASGTPRDAEEVSKSTEPAGVDSGATVVAERADPGPAEVLAVPVKPAEAPAAAQPSDSAAPKSNKLNRWLSKSGVSASSTSSAPNSQPGSSPATAQPANPPPSGPIPPPGSGAPGSKPIFGAPFQGLDEGSGWYASKQFI